MALTLRDSHSYETQIIDAVRGVNRALGGTYGTSSAIYKSEFNQYEVQLIDAIKGIGRTLSGNGLNIVGGGASAAELQRLSQRVSKLESESFFRLVDGNITLKEQYQNLWVPGWLAAGGVGTGGGGGGVSYLRQLEDIYHDSTGILRGNGDPVEDGDVIVYDETSGMWIAAANSPAGAVTNYGDITTGRIAKIGTVDIYNGVKWGSAGSEANTFTLTVNGVTKTVALQGYGGGGSGGGYIGTTAVQSTAQAQDLTGISSVKLSSSSSLFEWDATNSAWHFYGNIYSDGWISAGGTGTPGGGGGGVDLSEVWNSLTNTVADQWANTKINLAHIPNITASMVSDLGTWASNNLYTLRTRVSTTAANGVLLGVDALSNASSSATGGSDRTRMEWNAGLNAWHVYGNLYADGWVAAGGVGTGSGGGSLNDLSDVTLSSPTDGQFLIYDGTNQYWKNASLPIASASTLGGIKVGNNLSIDANGVLSATGGGVTYLSQLNDVDVSETYLYDGYVLTYQHSTGNYVLTAKSGGGGGGSTVSWGTEYSDHTAYLYIDGIATKLVCLDGYNSGGGGGSSTLAGLSDVTISSPSAGQILKYNGSGWVNGSAGGGSATALDDLSDVNISGLTDGQVLIWDATHAEWINGSAGGGGGGYIGRTAVQSTAQEQALYGILSINATQFVASQSRIVWDSTNNAWHFYGNIYADGFISAGGNA